MKTLLITTLTAIATLSTLNSSAALYNRGNGMIYDSSLNITWLQDANYAKTSGYDADGRMTWQQATDWAGNLVYGGFSGWRLSSAGIIGNSNFSYNGSTDNSYNNTRSEIGHLFFELNNKSTYNTIGYYQTNSGFSNQTFFNGGTGAPYTTFLNIQNSAYWEAETRSTNQGEAWLFWTSGGYQVASNKTNNNYAWAVHDGDVAAVPVPAAAWLLGSGLIGLAGIARRKK